MDSTQYYLDQMKIALEAADRYEHMGDMLQYVDFVFVAVFVIITVIHIRYIENKLKRKSKNK